MAGPIRTGQVMENNKQAKYAGVLSNSIPRWDSELN